MNEEKLFKHRPRFVMIDPLAIDKRVLYRVDGKFKIGLILHTERSSDGQLPVEQATPSEVLRAGKYRAPIVRTWHVLRWPKKEKAGAKSGPSKGI